MFDSLRDKFYNFQENLTTTLKGLSASDSVNRRQVVSETVSVNLNAGTDILDKFQTAWSELHENSQENATKADEVDEQICKLHKKVEKQWKDFGQLASCLASLPEVAHNVGELRNKILSLEKCFDAVEVALNQLKDILDTRDFQNRQLEQRFQLALYEEKKLAALESVRLKLSENLSEKVKIHEIKQQRLLRECQIASEENFKEDLKVYKETKTVTKIDFAKSKSKDTKDNMLEDIVLDSEDTNALNEFLNDNSKESEAEIGKQQSADSTGTEKQVWEDIVLKRENQSADALNISVSPEEDKSES